MQEGGELEEAMEQAASESSKNIVVPPASSGSMGGILGDVMSEVAKRPAAEDDDDKDVLPMNAGLNIMAPGPIVPKPIKGMDGEWLLLRNLVSATPNQDFFVGVSW